MPRANRKSATVAHLKCETCRIRVRSQHSPIGGVGALCPSCGSLLEPVAKLSVLVGYQESRPTPDELQEWVDVSRWLDDGGRPPEPMAQAVAVALPVPPLPGR